MTERSRREGAANQTRRVRIGRTEMFLGWALPEWTWVVCILCGTMWAASSCGPRVSLEVYLYHQITLVLLWGRLGRGWPLRLGSTPSPEAYSTSLGGAAHPGK